MIEMKIPERLKYLPCCLKCGKVDVGYKIQTKQGFKLKTCRVCNSYVYLYKDFKINKDPERSKRLLFLATVGIFFFAVALGQSTEFIFWAVFLGGLYFYFTYLCLACNQRKNAAADLRGVDRQAAGRPGPPPR